MPLPLSEDILRRNGEREIEQLKAARYRSENGPGGRDCGSCAWYAYRQENCLNPRVRAAVEPYGYCELWALIPSRSAYEKDVDLRVSPGRYKKGEYVYTCRCSREGERDWMVEHLEKAHGITHARLIENELRAMPKRREYANVREPR